jgi:predicted dehydrogenase
VVAGNPNIRPAWFFDVAQQGEGVADVGTHLVDLIQWMLFPEQAIDYEKDVDVRLGRRWPTRSDP